MRKETKDKIMKELRFFMHTETYEEAHHSVFHSVGWIMLIMAFLIPEIIALGMAGMIIWTSMQWEGILVFSTLMLIAVIQIPHYLNDRKPRKITEEIIPLTDPRYWAHRRSAMDEAEKARAS